MIVFFQTYGQIIGFAIIIGSLVFLLISMLAARPKVKLCCKIGQIHEND